MKIKCSSRVGRPGDALLYALVVLQVLHFVGGRVQLGKKTGCKSLNRVYTVSD